MLHPIMKEIKSLLWVFLHLRKKIYHLVTPSHQIIQELQLT